jgi:hypothetical protein
VDASGAGDHLDNISFKIRRIKEMVRTVIMGLPFKINKDRLEDIATYVVNLHKHQKNKCVKQQFTTKSKVNRGETRFQQVVWFSFQGL